MKIEEYISQRVDSQIVWLNRKSIINKRHFYVFSFVSAIGSIVTSTLISSYDRIAIVLSVVVAVSIALQNLFKFHSKWNIYRFAAERLEREKLIFLMGAKPYDQHNDKDFVINVEKILEETSVKWSQQMFKEGASDNR